MTHVKGRYSEKEMWIPVCDIAAGEANDKKIREHCTMLTRRIDKDCKNGINYERIYLQRITCSPLILQKYG